MRLRTALALLSFSLAAWVVLQAQKPFKQYPGIEYDHFPLPPGADRPSEWTRARLRYPDVTGNGFGGRRFAGFEAFPGYWTMDYPRADRHTLEGVRRLTRIDARPVEQVVELDGSDEIYNWPNLYGVEVGHWDLPQNQAKQLRDYLLRGGFLMVDDFHGTVEWQVFEESLERVFPDRQWADIPDSDPIFHVLYDLLDRVQIPGQQFLRSGRTYERDGYDAHWRAIYDDKGRIMVAICHNMDMGDAIEWSDDPKYPEKYAALAFRINMNYFVYDLTH
jgi:uncharacterized protein DUF4159